MITVTLNDEPHKIEKNDALIDFLAKHSYVTGCYAVMLNQNFVSSAYHTTTLLCDGDVIEIITPMQGG